MDSESNKDFMIDESDLIGGKSKKTVSMKTRPKDIVLNALSAVLIFVVVFLCNLFISPEFHYEQIYSWNFGLLVVVNWVCGILITYFLRKSGINTAKMTKPYIESEIEKAQAFDKITDFETAQKKLNEKIEKDFDMRRSELENAIAKLVRPFMPKDENGVTIEWTIGKPLPPKTPLRIRKMEIRLRKMTPSQLSLVALVQSEATFTTKSLYDVRTAPDKTGAVWFASKGGGKIGWFAVAPVVLSVLANGLSGGVSISNIVSTVGIVAVMLFNAAREYSISYASVAKYGVERNKQIVKIINSIL